MICMIEIIDLGFMNYEEFEYFKLFIMIWQSMFCIEF